MIPFGEFWPQSWTTDSVISSLAIAGGASSANSGTIAATGSPPNQVADIEIGIAIGYGSTITGGGVTVWIVGDVDGTHFESVTTDAPFSFLMPVTASTTVRRRLAIPAQDLSRLQVVISNPSTNSSVTATLFYHSAQGQFGTS